MEVIGIPSEDIYLCGGSESDSETENQCPKKSRLSHVWIHVKEFCFGAGDKKCSPEAPNTLEIGFRPFPALLVFGAPLVFWGLETESAPPRLQTP